MLAGAYGPQSFKPRSQQFYQRSLLSCFVTAQKRYFIVDSAVFRLLPVHIHIVSLAMGFLTSFLQERE